MALLARLVDREKRGIHPRHLPGADADRGLALGEQDRVRLDCPDGRPGEPQVGPFRLGGRAPRDDFPFHLGRRPGRSGTLLDEEAAADPLEVPARRVRIGGEPEDTQVLLLSQYAQRVIPECGRDHHLDEQLTHRLGGGAVQPRIERDHRPEGRRAVRRECALVCCGRDRAQGDAARGGVFDDGARRAVGAAPRRHRRERGVHVEQVVERELLAVQLLHVADAGLVDGVQRRRLVGILSVA